MELDSSGKTLLLVIDVQNKQGSVEEIYVRDGDSAYRLAEDFVLRQGLGLHRVRAVGAHILMKVHKTGFRTEPDGRCFMAPARAGPNPVVCAASDPFLNSGSLSSTAQSSHRSRDTSVERLRHSRGYEPLRPREGDQARQRTSLQDAIRRLQRTPVDENGHARNAGQCESGGIGNVAWRVKASSDQLRQRCRRTRQEPEPEQHPQRHPQPRRYGGADRCELPTGWDGDYIGHGDQHRSGEEWTGYSGESGRDRMTEYTQLSNDGYDWRNETVDLGSWTPRELQQHGEQSDGCRGRDNDGISGGRTDDNRHCHDVDKSSRDLLLDSYYWWRDHNKTETSCDEVPFRRSRAPSWILPVDNIKQSNGNITWAGDEHVHDPEAFPRWRDKPRPQTNNDEIGRWELESGGIAGVARHRRTSSPGGACCGAARLGYRSRGAPGRRPISREGARQLHTSKRLHHVSETIARKRETAIQKRNDVIQANLAAASSGRLNLCPKTRALTDNSSKYKYGGGGGGERNYVDIGDRLYSEWEAGRTREARRRELTMGESQEREDTVEGEERAFRRETWCCPKCGTENRAQDDTCQTVTGIVVPAQELKPHTWYLESTEQLGRAAAAAVAAGTPSVAGGQGDHNCRRDRVSNDGLRRCGRSRPSMFKPTPLARSGGDSVIKRPEGELLFDRLYRNPPTVSRKRAQDALVAETRATYTFAPSINERSLRLAEAQAARRTLEGDVQSSHYYEDSSSNEQAEVSSRGSSTDNDSYDSGGGGGGNSPRRRGRRRRLNDGVGWGGGRSSAATATSQRLYGDHWAHARRIEEKRKKFFKESCPFTPDIGLSAAWPAQDASTEEFFRRLHDEHREQLNRLEERHRRINRNVLPSRRHRNGGGASTGVDGTQRSSTSGCHGAIDPDGAVGESNEMYSGHISSRPRANAGSAAVEDNREARADHSGGSVTVISSSLAASEEAVHTRLWERSLELQHRRAAEECRREETRRARATEGHVNDRSAELLRAMRVRSLMQTYRTLLASVEYARLPEGLDYDEAMESIMTKINAIFDNDNDAWQDMPLEVSKADPSVLKPELIDLVTQALAGHGGEILVLTEFCELLDASVRDRMAAGGPIAHIFASSAGRSAAGFDLAEKAAAARLREAEERENRELTFRPRIDRNSDAIARERMGRDGSKAIENVLRQEMLRKEKRRGDLQLQREQVFQREHPFCPTRFASKPTTTPNCAPRYPNELTTDGEVAALATATAAGAEGVAGSGIAAVPAT